MTGVGQKTKNQVKLEIMTVSLIKGRVDTLQSYIQSLPTFKMKYTQYDLFWINFYGGFLALHNNHLDIAKKCFEEIKASDDEDDDWRWRKTILLAELADLEGDYTRSQTLWAQVLQVIERRPDQKNLDIMFIKALLAGYLAKEGNTTYARELITPLVEDATKYLSLHTIYFKYLAGMVELTDEDFDKAAEYFNENIEDCISLAELHCCAQSHRALGEIAVARQDFTGARKHFESTMELCKTMGLPTERLYYSYTCYTPSRKFDGWRLYKEGNDMFKIVD
ncbi:hypothetical protein C0989_003354 [Termitomyces sp. Mn162]|nr:hypothetical protein C0989_003354 [Termitomyces sp. Mn162]